jgi:hypothetical protein
MASSQRRPQAVEVRQPPGVGDELASRTTWRPVRPWAAGTDSVMDRPERVRTMTWSPSTRTRAPHPSSFGSATHPSMPWGCQGRPASGGRQAAPIHSAGMTVVVLSRETSCQL